MSYNIATFHKCGSNWFRSIYWEIANRLDKDYVPSREWRGALTTAVERQGDPIYIFAGGRRDDLKKRYGAQSWKDEKVLLCVRDPRDAIVSQYFSWRNSHKNNSKNLLEYRKRLQSLDVKEGLQLLIKDKMFYFGNSFEHWIVDVKNGRNVRVTKYEDLHRDFMGTMQSDGAWLGLDLSGVDLDQVKAETSFSAKTGRKLGDENENAHLRKGTPGDYQRFFDDDVTALFDDTYGHLVRVLGY